MDQENRFRFLSYVVLMVAFFLILFILDKIFVAHYDLPEHHTEEHVEEAHTRAEHLTENLPSEEPENFNQVEEIQNDSFEKDESEPSDGQTYYKQLKNRYQTDVLSKLTHHQARTDIVIRYYHHEPDGNSAYELRDLGYYIHERPVDPKYAEFQSNAIYYGDSVKLEDVQLVAYTLLNEGLPIKEIRSSKFSDSWKARSIEIGTDTTLLHRPTLTYDEIKKLHF